MRCLLILSILAAPLCAQGSDPIDWAIESLLDYRQIEKARSLLQAHADSEAVIDAARAALERDTPSVRGKQEILKLLVRMKSRNLVEAAIASPVRSTRRAAAYTLSSAPQFREPVREVVLGWLGDKTAYDQDWAVILSRKLQLEAALPTLRKMMADPAISTRMLDLVLDALTEQPTLEFEEALLNRLRDPNEKQEMVASLLRAARKLRDFDAEEVAVAWLKRKESKTDVRMRAAWLVRDSETLRGVLLDPSEKDWVVQRWCLRRLLEILDADSLYRLALKKEVHRHPYYAIRVDVAVLLACRPTTAEADLAILRDYLVDEDEKDTQFLVRQEGWLSLWTVTGVMHGVQDGELFSKAPPRGDLKRGFLPQFMRHGVTKAMIEALDPLSADLEHMQRVRAAYAR